MYSEVLAASEVHKQLEEISQFIVSNKIQNKIIVVF